MAGGLGQRQPNGPDFRLCHGKAEIKGETHTKKKGRRGVTMEKRISGKGKGTQMRKEAVKRKGRQEEPGTGRKEGQAIGGKAKGERDITGGGSEKNVGRGPGKENAKSGASISSRGRAERGGGQAKAAKGQLTKKDVGAKGGTGPRKGEAIIKDHMEEGQKAVKLTGRLCKVSQICGGCQYLHLPYEEQLKLKQQQLNKQLHKFAKVYPIVGMENPLHYRNKVHAVFGYRKGEVVSGVYQEGTHKLVPVEQCVIEDEKADEIIASVRRLVKSFKIRTYDEDRGYGLLRHVLVRRGFATGETMVVLVTASPVFPSKNNFVKELLRKHPEITTIVQNINGRDTNMVLGEREQILWGKGYIEDELCGYRFRISSRSFYQVNPVQTTRLYQKAVALAELTGQESVLDAYCGIGAMGILASGKARQVVGVESNPDAVRDAVKNARRNKVSNIQFYCNDATQFMAQMAADGERLDVVIMDPPRCGSTEEFVKAVAAVKAKRVVYVSCGPDTLARDLAVFQGLGYQAEGVWGYDLFPETRHIECVVQIKR